MALTKFINKQSEFVEHSSIGSVQTHKQQYVLNIKKSLANKLNCAKKNQITYQITGGGFTAEYDAVTFELLRNACDIYYISSNEFFSGVNKDDMNDRTGNLVQRTYKLHDNDNASCEWK